MTMPSARPVLARIPDADEALTAGLARTLAAVLRAGDCLLLDGPVGAGKTHFARALIRARQGDLAEDVPSPTFTIVQTYADAAGTEIWHADLYRLTDPSELVELGLDEALDEAITLIEWPDRLGAPPPGALTVALRETAPDRREIVLSGDPARWRGISRLAQIATFLHGAGWSTARLAPLAGDASTRRYFRLSDEGRRAVLMDDPPPGSVPRYLAMTDWLRTRGFHAPEILAQDAAEGLLLMEDLGDRLVARVLREDPARTGALYARITDLLAGLGQHPPPGFAPPLDGPELAAQVGLFADWYVPATGRQGGAGVAPAIAVLWDRLCADTPPVTGLRDFHAENIVLLDDGSLGLLDFQDAVAVHPAYDLVSLLQDARRDIDAATEAACLARYAAATGTDPDRFAAAYALLGAQRGLRIMGIFTRLCIRDGKPRYLDFMPRVWAAIQRDASHPALEPLRAALDGIPGPSGAIIERIRARCASPTP